MNYYIKDAEKVDAPEIASGITGALHIGEPDAAITMENDDIDRWLKIFTELAGREDTQYSYTNTLKAVDENGHILGIIIGYDGAKLKQLREPFFEAVMRHCGEDFSGIPDETSPDEWYLDSLWVRKEYRGKGIGSELLRAASKRAFEHHKPAGLLVAKDNFNARKLYDKIGFKYVGDRMFANELMDHLQLLP